MRIFRRQTTQDGSDRASASRTHGDDFDETVRARMRSSFVRDAVSGSARLQIQISEIGDLCSALMKGLEEHGTLDQRQLEQGLHGVCPKCGTRLKGAGLLMVTFAGRFEHAVFAGGEMTARVLAGQCANADCKSREIIIEWDG